MIKAYFPTIHTKWAELRVICAKGTLARVRWNAGDWIALAADCDDHYHSYYRKRFTDLTPDCSYTVEIEAGGTSKRISFRTLGQLSGPRRVAFGLLPDSHIQPSTYSRPLSGPTRRLYAAAEELAFRYVKRLEEQGVDLILFPGDTLDPCTDHTMETLRDLMASVSTPCHVLIGNHETYGPYTERDFHIALDLPTEGSRTIVANDVAFILLSTPEQDSLAPSRRQFGWLKEQLDGHARRRDTFVVAHFSLLLHPCVQGWKNDGMQQLDDFRAVLDLFQDYPRIRAFIGGHKNLPSRIMHQGIPHLLTPQLIQAPCSYSIIEAYEDGFIHNVFEIEEQAYAELSRSAYGDAYPERYGSECDRNYVHRY